MKTRLLTIMLVLLIGLQIGMLMGRPPAKAQISGDTEMLIEMRRQTELLRSIDRRLDRIYYEQRRR